MTADFEDLLEKTGGYGTYQKMLVATVLIPTSFFIAYTVNTPLFQTFVPTHWCHVPGRSNTSYTVEQWINLTIPLKDDGQTHESCVRFELLKTDNDDVIRLNTTKECDYGWDYDDTYFTSTIASSRQWFCEMEVYSTHIMSIGSAGSAIGTIILPIIADKYVGRRRMFFVSTTIYLIFVLPIIFVKNPDLHLFFRFCVGVAFQTNYQMPYLIVLELLPPNMRALAAFYSFVAWTLCMCLTALISWLIPHWQYLAALAAIPSVLAFLLWRILPESPRWLLSKGNLEECADILHQISKKNKKDLKRCEIMNDLMMLHKEQQTDDLSLRYLLKYPKIVIRITILFVLSVAIFLIYGCILFNINILPDYYFLNYFILSFFELPANVIGWLLVNYLGRRATAIILMVCSAVFAIVASLCHEDKIALLAAVVMLKIFSTDGIYVMFVSTGELLPTPIRSTGLGIMAVGGLVGITISPYVVHNNLGPEFEYYVILAVSLFALLLAIYIPETIGLPLPQTFSEAETIGNNRPFFAWIHHWNMHRYMPVSTKDEDDNT